VLADKTAPAFGFIDQPRPISIKSTLPSLRLLISGALSPSAVADRILALHALVAVDRSIAANLSIAKQ